MPSIWFSPPPPFRASIFIFANFISLLQTLISYSFAIFRFFWGTVLPLSYILYLRVLGQAPCSSSVRDRRLFIVSYFSLSRFSGYVVACIRYSNKSPKRCSDQIGILNFALSGDVLKAIELTEQLIPDLLEKDTDLHFDLLSLQFVELVCSRKCTEALEFAEKKLSSFGKVQKYREKLEDFMALLAYEEPEKSPMFHLLSPEYRQQVTDSLNRAILAYLKLPSYSSLERLIQQTTVVRQHLNQDQGKDASLPFSLKDFLKG